MILELAILELLQKAANDSRGEARLSQKQIQEGLRKKYTALAWDPKEIDKTFTRSKIRTALDRLISHNDQPGISAVIKYTPEGRAKGGDYKTDFHVSRQFSDMELKFLIDAVMYSGTLDSQSAEDLTGRLKALADRRLAELVPYTSAVVFGERGPASNVDVLNNMKTILEAMKACRYLQFTKNVYNAVDNRWVLTPESTHCVIPLQVFFDNGQYYMLVQYGPGKKDYTYRLDVMTDLEITQKQVFPNNEEQKLVQYRAEYIKQHPFAMSGKPERYTLRVDRKILTILVNTFGSSATMIPGTVTDTTVDVRVKASSEGMKYWLLMNYKEATLLHATGDLMGGMHEAAEILAEKYSKK